MKNAGGLFGFLAMSTILSAQEAVPWRTTAADISIPMRDGKNLLADVFLPQEPGRYPTILIQTPYDKTHLRAPITNAASVEDTGEVGRGAVSDLLALADRAHYAYVVVDWRGFYKNKSAMRGVDKRKWRRGHDGYDAVEWIAKQPWSNTRVGTWGGSALGKQQFNTASEQPPHLVCCVPLIASMGSTYEQYFERGVPLDAHLKILDALGYDMRTLLRENPLPGTLFWRMAERVTDRPQTIQVPCLMITGWWDNYPDSVIRTFEDIVRRGGPAARDQSKLLIGPWDHVGVGLREQGDLEFPRASLASAAAAKAFFDFHLRGVQNDWSETPRVRYFDSGDRRWLSAESFSGIDRDETVLYGSPDGRLELDPGEATADGSRSYAYDPRRPSPTLGGANLPPLRHGPRVQNPLLDRADVVVHRTGPLDEPLLLNGKLAVGFTFTADRVDCDFCLRLCDVDENGRAHLLADTAARAKLRNGKVELLEPGEPTRIEIEFPNNCHTFRAGHELLLILTSGNSPRYERNPHTGQDLWDRRTALPLAVDILFGTKSPFVLRVPRTR